MKNKGFTLAEVLITLVIIGVVAALTVPTMMNNKRNEELRAGLLKAQSTLAGALEKYYVQNGVRIAPETVHGSPDLTILKNVLLHYLSSAKDCGKGTETTACLTSLTSKYRTFNGKTTLNFSLLDDGQIILNDGSMILIENCNTSLILSVDVNGYKKKPNKAGHDLFSFEINSKGNFVPMGAKGTRYYSETAAYCSETSTSAENGFGCTAKALADPNYFKNLH